jgi:hypothetical protein
MDTDGRYKLLRELDSGTERLFDRREDPRELQDVSEDNPAVYRELAAAIDEHLRGV